VEVGFYHLQRTALEPALARLLERVLASGQRAVVRASSADRVEALNRALWTIGQGSFLPHGSRADGFAEDQPVFLTEAADYPNGATVLVLVDGAEVEPPPEVTRCLYLFDGNDPQAVAGARERWRRWRERGAEITYWQQTERGWRNAAAADAGGR
jgi:DNA polymerase-3 subunit chi